MALNITSHFAAELSDLKYGIQFYGFGSFTGLAPGCDWDDGTVISVSASTFSLGGISLQFATYGVKNLVGVFYDREDGVTTHTYNFTITVEDNRLPTVTVNKISGVLNSRTIPITITATATGSKTITEYSVSYQSNFPTSWVVDKPTSYTVPSNGDWRLFVFVRDSGNEWAQADTGYPLFTVIEADTTAPTITSFSILDTIADTLIVPITTLYATDNTGVSAYIVQLDPTPPLSTASGWSSSVSSYTLPYPGAFTLYAFAKDANGNVSASASDIVVATSSFNLNTNISIFSSTIITTNVGVVADTNVSIGFTTNLVAIDGYLEWTYSSVGAAVLNGPCTRNMIPIMTSATTPRGTVESTTAVTAHDAYLAFDGNATDTYFSTAIDAKYLSYTFQSGEAYPLVSYIVKADVDTTDPTGWQLQGYNGITWENIGSAISAQTFSTGETKSYSVNSNTAYYGYKLSAITPASTSIVSIRNVEFYTCAPQIVQSTGDTTSTFSLIGSTSALTATLVSWQMYDLVADVNYFGSLVANQDGYGILTNFTFINSLSTDVSIGDAPATINCEISFNFFGDSPYTDNTIIGEIWSSTQPFALNNTFNNLLELAAGGYTILNSNLGFNLSSTVATGQLISSSNMFNNLFELNTTAIVQVVTNVNEILTHIDSINSVAIGGQVASVVGTIGYNFDLGGTVGKVSTLEANLYQFDIEASAYFNVVGDLTVNFANITELNSFVTTLGTTTSATTWTINTMTKAHSTYSNFDFNSFITEDNKIYGAMSDGIYELTGERDDTLPITAKLTTAVLDFNSAQHKFIPDLYIHARTQGSDLLATTITEESKQVDYDVLGDDVQGMRNRRLKLAKGIHGRSWQFSIQNVDGGIIELESLTVNPVQSQRRI